MAVWEHLTQEQRDFILKHSELCEQLRAKGYTIQGSHQKEGFKKTYFADGNKPFEKIIGYIDKDTMEIIYF